MSDDNTAGSGGIATPPADYRNYLLVIAINDYEHPSISNLKNCINDAQGFIKLLTEEFEFEREHVRFLCSGIYDLAFQDVVMKPTPDKELKIIERELLKIELIFEKGVAFIPTTKDKALIIKTIEKVRKAIRETENPFALPEKRLELLKLIGELKASFEKPAPTKVSENVRNYLFEELNELEKNIQFVQKPATREHLFMELREMTKTIKEEQEANPNLKINLILYYSGHGHFDKFLDQGYWIPADSELGDFANFVSNSTIRDFLSSFKTHHTLLIADACFSGTLFISGDTRNLVSEAMEKVPSRWGLTAGRNEPVSDGIGREDLSPFSKAVLDTLKTVESIGVNALYERVKALVAPETDQIPRGEPLRVPGHEGGEFMFRKKKNAEKHFKTAKLLLQLAEYRPEHARYRSAAEQFRMARRLARKRENQATYTWWWARAIALAGRVQEAAEELEKHIRKKEKQDEFNPLRILLSYFYLLLSKKTGEADASQALVDKATSLLDEVEEISDLPLPAMAQFIQQESGSQKGALYLLSVGINTYKHWGEKAQVCIEDTRLIEKVLREKLDFTEFHHTSLTEDQATHKKILTSLEEIKTKLKPEDQFFFHFSGVSVSLDKLNNNGNTPFLATYDSQSKMEGPDPMISCEKLHQIMEEMPTSQKVLILDIHGNDAFHSLAKEGNYALLMGTSGEEKASDVIGQKNIKNSLFTWVLADAIQNGIPGEGASAEITNRMRQQRKEVTPFFSNAQEFFNRLNDEGLLQRLLDFIYGPVRHREKGAQLARFLLEDITRHELSLSPAEELSLAQACQRVGASQEAAVFFERHLALPVDSETADAEIYLPRWRVHAALAQIYLAQGFPEKASPHLTACLEFREDIPEALVEKLEQESKAVAQKLSPSKRALLIGIDEYRFGERLHQGFTKDVDAWKGALAKMGYAAKDITILKDKMATRENILKEFDALAKHAEDFPAFFFFAGKGTRDSSGSNMALLAVNQDKDNYNPQPSPITFQELASRSRNTRHLTVVCDATFSDKSAAPSYGPSSPDPIQEQPARIYFGKSMIDTPFGNTCILSGSKAESGGHVPTYSRMETENGGALSQQLIEAALANPDARTPETLIHKMIEEMPAPPKR